MTPELRKDLESIVSKLPVEDRQNPEAVLDALESTFAEKAGVYSQSEVKAALDELLGPT